jgi:hypothetical protein
MYSHDTPIPYGYCHCGCGQQTTIQTKNSPAKRLKKGEPAWYAAGHYRRNGTPHPMESRPYEPKRRQRPSEPMTCQNCHVLQPGSAFNGRAVSNGEA